ncbi:sarcoplasmic reticulum histidine-rich calcium-binding protein-like [Mya arenaria]|uniref:sarcoplasmic reticulum histidine-rich calcium-binding protein-like n=1 Tax=Mya arenaria TaxID=6604 RepID=UPI0022E5A44B|nr:sarcoplasmic reticulum histidine-rich calcium-binding protein-like [Mya arenaria]
MNVAKISVVLIVFSVFIVFCHSAGTEKVKEMDQEEAKVDEEKLEYAKGSLCTYCDHCKFCTLCDEQCPCETSATKPNCHMCKYCKFCHLCKVCDAVCQPGGILDRVTAAMVNALPSFNKDEVDSDLDSVKEWIDKKDEL